MGRLAIPALALVACGGPTAQNRTDLPEPAGPGGVGSSAVAQGAAPDDDADRLERVAATAGDDGDDDEPVLSAADVPPAASSASSKSAPPFVIKPLGTSKLLSKRDLALFNSFCQLDEDAKAVGCRCCPDQPASQWCAGGTADRQTTIGKVFYGAFTQAGAKEAYATGAGYSCGNLSAWGVSWFLRQERQQWSLVRGESYVHQVLHGAVWDLADGRRGIVTHDVIHKSFTNAIAFTTFAPNGAPKRTELLRWSNSACIHRVPGYYQSVVLYGGANPYDHNKDGKRDLVITLKVKRRFADAAFEKECGVAFNQAGAPSPFDRAPTTTHAIPLLFDGAGFTVERRALARFGKATAEVDKQGNPFDP